MLSVSFFDFPVISMLTVLGSVSGFFLMATLLIRAPRPVTQWVLFLGISIPAFVATLYLVVSTAKLNLTSVTRGPVHWHADFMLYQCGKEIELKKPGGLANRIGTPLLHEHGDRRIHVEGVVSQLKDVTLQRFFENIGGELTNESIAIPTKNEELLLLSNGQRCSNGLPAALQIFVYSTQDGHATQRKLGSLTEYVPAAETLVPPGDCIIVEFGPERERTDRLCAAYQIAEQKDELIID